VTIFNV